MRRFPSNERYSRAFAKLSERIVAEWLVDDGDDVM